MEAGHHQSTCTETTFVKLSQKLILLFPRKNTHKKHSLFQTASLSFFPTHPEKKTPPRKKNVPSLHTHSKNTTFTPFLPPPEKNDVLHQGPCTFTVFLGWTFRNPTWHIRRQADATAKETQLLQVQKMDPFNKNTMDFQTGMRYT